MLQANPKRFLYDQKQDRYFCMKDQVKQMQMQKQQGFMSKVTINEKIFSQMQIGHMLKSKQQRFRNPLNQSLVNLAAVIHKQHRLFIQKTRQGNCQDIVLVDNVYCTISLQPLTNNHNLLKISIFNAKSFNRLNLISVKVLGIPNIAKVINSQCDQTSKSSKVQMIFCTSYSIRIISLQSWINQDFQWKTQFKTDWEKQIEAVDQAQVCNGRIYYIKESKLGIIELDEKESQTLKKTVKLSKKLSSMHFKRLIKIRRGVALITKCLHIVILDSIKKDELIFRTGILLDEIFIISETDDKISFIILSAGSYKLLEIPYRNYKNAIVSQPIFQSLPFCNSEKGFKIVRSQITQNNFAFLTFQQLKYEGMISLDRKLIACLVTFKERILQCYQILRYSTDGYEKVLQHLLKDYQQKLLQQKQKQNKQDVLKSQDFNYLFSLK